MTRLHRTSICLLLAIIVGNITLCVWLSSRVGEMSTAKIVQKAYVVSRLISEASGRAMASRRPETIGTTIEEALKDQHLVAVVVKDDKGETLFESQDVATQEKLSTFDTPIMVKGKPAGHVITRFRFDTDDSWLVTVLKRVVACEAALLAGIIVLLLFALWRGRLRKVVHLRLPALGWSFSQKSPAAEAPAEASILPALPAPAPAPLLLAWHRTAAIAPVGTTLAASFDLKPCSIPASAILLLTWRPAAEGASVDTTPAAYPFPEFRLHHSIPAPAQLQIAWQPAATSPSPDTTQTVSPPFDPFRLYRPIPSLPVQLHLLPADRPDTADLDAMEEKQPAGYHHTFLEACRAVEALQEALDAIATISLRDSDRASMDRAATELAAARSDAWAATSRADTLIATSSEIAAAILRECRTATDAVDGSSFPARLHQVADELRAHAVTAPIAPIRYRAAADDDLFQQIAGDLQRQVIPDLQAAGEALDATGTIVAALGPVLAELGNNTRAASLREALAGELERTTNLFRRAGRTVEDAATAALLGGTFATGPAPAHVDRDESVANAAGTVADLAAEAKALPTLLRQPSAAAATLAVAAETLQMAAVILREFTQTRSSALKTGAAAPQPTRQEEQARTERLIRQAQGQIGLLLQHLSEGLHQG